jgi:four helix bundle protein
LQIARGSLSELETQLILARKLNYAHDLEKIMGRVEKVFALLGGLINREREGK